MPCPRASRRQFLSGLGAGFGSLALAGLLADESRAAIPADPLSARPAPGRPRAKRATMLFMFGGPANGITRHTFRIRF